MPVILLLYLYQSFLYFYFFNVLIIIVLWIYFEISEAEDALHFISEVHLETYDGTFHDYAEAVVQFGYVNMFSVVSKTSDRLTK